MRWTHIRHVPALRLKISRKRQPELHRQAGRTLRQQLHAKIRRFIRAQAQAGRRITKGRVQVQVKVLQILRHIRLQAGLQIRPRLRTVTALQAGRVHPRLRVTALQAGRAPRLRVTARRAGRVPRHRVQARRAGRPAAVVAVPVRAAAHVEDDISCV
jgi:hypothetical protein